MTGGSRRMDIVRRAGLRPFSPRVSAFSKRFWDALSEGRLTTTGCNACGRLSFPPKPICRACWFEDMLWRDLAPGGTLYSFTHIHVMPRAFADDGPLSIAIVDLSDGLRLMCRIMADCDRLRPDMAIEMIALAYDDGPLFAARPKGT